jgi:hypothetical protein
VLSSASSIHTTTVSDKSFKKRSVVGGVMIFAKIREWIRRKNNCINIIFFIFINAMTRRIVRLRSGRVKLAQVFVRAEITLSIKVSIYEGLLQQNTDIKVNKGNEP